MISRSLEASLEKAANNLASAIRQNPVMATSTLHQSQPAPVCPMCGARIWRKVTYMKVPPARPWITEDTSSVEGSSGPLAVRPIPIAIPRGAMTEKIPSQANAFTGFSMVLWKSSRPRQYVMTFLWMATAANTDIVSARSLCSPTAKPSNIVWKERAMSRRKARTPGLDKFPSPLGVPSSWLSGTSLTLSSALVLTPFSTSGFSAVSSYLWESALNIVVSFSSVAP